MPLPLLAAMAPGIISGIQSLTSGITRNNLSGAVGPIASGIVGGLNAAEQARANREAAQVSRENTDKTLSYQRQAADLAWNRDIAQWHAQNRYNSPIEAMGRLKGAGLNPMLVYGSGSPAGESGPSPKMSVPNYQANYQARGATQIDPALAMSAGGIANTIADLQIKKAQKSNIEASTRSTNMATSLDSMEATMKAIDVLLKERNAKAGVRAAEAAAGKSEQELRNLATQQFLENQKLGWQSIQAAREDYQSKTLFPYQVQFQEGNLREQRKRIENLTQGISASKQQVRASQASEVNTYADTALKELQYLLNNEELFQERWESYLNSKGTSSKDNVGVRQTMIRGANMNEEFANFIQWFLSSNSGRKR